MVDTRPFRSPHHTASTVSLSGGGGIPRPGEISLAHNGVLFLDELPEFHRDVLEALRQPLEDGIVTVARAGGTLRLPAQFQLVCAMNPCKCGWRGHPSGKCTCSDKEVEKYVQKISGPLLDRIDLHVNVPSVEYEAMRRKSKPESSAQVKELELPQQLIYRRTYRSNNVADKTVLLRNTALEAMRAHGTDITRRMYFIQFPIDRPAEVSFCVAVPPGSEGEYVETTAPMRAICIYHHGAYEELPAVGRQLLDYAKEHGLTPQGILRHTYLEGPPQHKDPAKFITQVILPIV